MLMFFGGTQSFYHSIGSKKVDTLRIKCNTYKKTKVTVSFYAKIRII